MQCHQNKRDWLSATRRYYAVTGVLHLVWEFAHMPLYALWETGTPQEIISAAVHCTGGDLLIALAALSSATLLFGHKLWPNHNFARVFAATLAIGIGYTTFNVRNS